MTPGPTPLDQPPAWVRDAVLYQIFPDRFARSPRVEEPEHLEAWDAPPTIHGYKGGDLLGVVDHLDWLSDLGITAIYLNPIFQSASNHRYHTYDYYRVDPLLGGDAAFRELLDACHERDIKVVIDGVFNHASRGFFQFNDLLENGAASPWRDWFIVHAWPLNAYGADGAINYEAWWGLAPLPEFNTENPEVREFLMRVGEHWARFGIDGWRLDVPAEITTEGFWEEFRERVRAVNPDIYIVGEIWHDASAWINDGDRFDGTMNYLFTSYTVAFAANRYVRTQELEGLSYQAYPPLDALTYGERIHTLLGGYRTEASLANLNLLGSHDTPRLLTIAGEDRDSMILAALLMFTYPGAPCVYYGDEIGLPGHRDPDNRRSFPWDHREDWDEEILEAHRSLIAVRRAEPALRSDDYHMLWPPAGEGTDMLYIFTRHHGDEALLVAVNAGDEAEVAAIAQVDLPGRHFEELWGTGDVAHGDNAVRISMRPRSGAIWRLVG